MPKSIFTVLVFSKINILRYFRDPVALFFTVAFPLIFLFVFGGIFGKNSATSFNVAVVNQSQTQFAADFDTKLHDNKMFKINKSATTLEEAKKRMARSEVDATIVLPVGFGAIQDGKTYPGGNLEIYYTQTQEQAAQTLASVLEGTFTGINAQFVKNETPFTVQTKPSNQAGLSRFDYTFSGLLGFSIIGLGIFGPINVFPELKKQGVLRRLKVTPIHIWQYFVSNVFSQAIIGLFAVSVLVVVARTVFHLQMRGNYINLALFVMIGIFTIFGIGLAIGGWAKNQNQAAPLANAVVFPMMFLTGTFFPRFLMPDWLQHVSGYLPLTPVIDGIRMIITENKGLLELGPQLGLIAIWAIIIYAIAFRVFRWE